MTTDNNVMPSKSGIHEMQRMAREIVFSAERMVNYLEKFGIEEIDCNRMELWADMKTVSTLAEPIVSLLAVIANQDFANDSTKEKEWACPYCGSTDATHGPYEDESGELQRECVCQTCGKNYREFFVFDSVDGPAE